MSPITFRRSINAAQKPPVQYLDQLTQQEEILKFPNSPGSEIDLFSMIHTQHSFNDYSALRIQYSEIRKGSLSVTARNISRFSIHMLKEKVYHR